MGAETEPLLSVGGLRVAIKRGRTVTEPVRGVDFTLARGERLAIVGESGSGKTMTASAILGLLPRHGSVSAGSIRLDGTEISTASEEEMRRIRGRKLGLIPQDPLSSLNPVYRIGAQLEEAIRTHEKVSRAAARSRAAELLDMVGIADASARLDAYPHQFSGGMRQRVLIAMALALRPRVLIADEPTTALDVTVQAQVLDLIDDLARDSGSAVILITHDLAVAAGRTDRILVMRHGEVMEVGGTAEVLADPQSPYTRALLESSPHFGRARKSRFSLAGLQEGA